MKVSSKEEWLELVGKIEASGLTKSEFFKRNRMSSTRFYELAKIYGDGTTSSSQGAKKGRKPKIEKPDFLKIDVALPASESTVTTRLLRIVTSYGTTLEIPL
jgi:hypothetical protein